MPATISGLPRRNFHVFDFIEVFFFFADFVRVADQGGKQHQNSLNPAHDHSASALSLLIVLWLTLYDLPMSVRFSPASRRAIASRRWCTVSLGLRPMMTPRALARCRPSPVRVRIRSRSNSARPPRTVSISRPCEVVVSAQVSRSDLNPAPFSDTSPSTFNRSRVDLASRSSRVTTSTSPFSKPAIAALSCFRSARAPARSLCTRPLPIPRKSASIRSIRKPATGSNTPRSTRKRARSRERRHHQRVQGGYRHLH